MPKSNLKINRQFSSKHFDEKELIEIFKYYPESYKSNLDKFYEAFQEYAVPFLARYNEIGVFLEFCKCTCRAYSSIEEAEEEFKTDFIEGKLHLRIGGIVSAMSRAIYYEVSNHNKIDNNTKLAEISSIVDCLHNNVLTEKKSNFKDALLMLDGLNPAYKKPANKSWDGLTKDEKNKYAKYWNELNMRTPVKSASGSLKDNKIVGGNHAALVYAYAISVVCYKYYRYDMQGMQYEWPKFSYYYGVDLPQEYVHFSEGDKAAKYSSKKVGVITFLTETQFGDMSKSRKNHKRHKNLIIG